MDQFARDGYLVLAGLIPPDLVERLKPEVDRWSDDGLRAASIEAALNGDTAGPPQVEIEMPAHGRLACLPDLMRVLDQVLGRDFVFHHMHSCRQDPTTGGKPWHHDYEGPESTDRDGLMVHALHYLDGLTEDVSPLVVVPGSHRRVVDKHELVALGTRPLDGEVVIDRLPPGSTVLAHSALWHARRKTARDAHSRYFIDTSYCQGDRRWRPVKPYWRDILRRAHELRLGRPAYPRLFDDGPFLEYRPPTDAR
ncbi:phytanoyl-CoA dioxygenase family protein [Micromonospora sp. NPDC049645]|uniref:phytanoyl-CoA dioxygenase family protein n=1 Tax=Micromonospora sp. NPDC049645 TaxID=3155508 RepID=UPI0034180BBD